MSQEDFERFSMPVGWILLGVGNAIGWVFDHGTQILGVLSLLIGTSCQMYGTWLKHKDAKRKGSV